MAEKPAGWRWGVKLREHLLQSIRSACKYNKNLQVAPVCVLWPDRERQWLGIMPQLQRDLPELFILGDYAPEKRTGPAIWLRCVLGDKIDGLSWPENCVPVIYLPGVSRQDLRAVENCPDFLKPLAELQHRGFIWSQVNHKDWTIMAYIKSESGLGLDVARDNETRNAMQAAFGKLLDVDLSGLKGMRLDKNYFNELLSGADPVRDLLQWLNAGESFEKQRTADVWGAFLEVCKKQFDFNPQTAGLLSGGERLANHEGPWKKVWERFCEAPDLYPEIPDLIRKCSMPAENEPAFFRSVCDGWPQWNDNQEQKLRRDLLELENEEPLKARQKLLELNKSHGQRRAFVWAKTGAAPLALAMEYLALLAEITQENPQKESFNELFHSYVSKGWQADDALMRALSQVNESADFQAVSVALRAVYQPWAESLARQLQKVVSEGDYPGNVFSEPSAADYRSGDCVFFVDGLRFDLGRRLADMLQGGGFLVEEEPYWTPLPSVTATGKAAVSPVADKVKGLYGCPDFNPVVAETEAALDNYHLRKLLTDAGWTVIDNDDFGNGCGFGWCEFGEIDQEGHNRGWKLARKIDELLEELRRKTAGLLAAGWKRVRIVTDHGWLLLPGGLPKIELSSVLSEHKWGRCASLKSGASTVERVFPWYWNREHFFALADGISCFKKGQEYAHGGLSLPECLTLKMVVSSRDSVFKGAIKIKTIKWKGLRCNLQLSEMEAGIKLDIRAEPGDKSSTMLATPPKINDDGSVFMFADDDFDGRQAVIVILNADDKIIAQTPVIIGGE
jgi:hypothetical protein